MSKGRHQNVARWAPNPRHILKRRVASLLSRGLAECEIVQQVSAEAVPDGQGGWRTNALRAVNPRTGKPYSQPTVNRIIHELLDEWAVENAEKVAEHRAQLIGENCEARRRLWADQNLAPADRYSLLIAAMSQMAKWVRMDKIIVETESRVVFKGLLPVADLVRALREARAEMQSDESAT